MKSLRLSLNCISFSLRESATNHLRTNQFHSSSKCFASTSTQYEETSSGSLSDRAPLAKPTVVHVGGISYRISKDFIVEKLFSNIPGFLRLSVPRAPPKSVYSNRGYGFAYFDTMENAHEAMRRLDGSSLDSRAISMNLAASEIYTMPLEPSEPQCSLYIGGLAVNQDLEQFRKRLEAYGTLNQMTMPHRRHDHFQRYVKIGKFETQI